MQNFAGNTDLTKTYTTTDTHNKLIYKTVPGWSHDNRGLTAFKLAKQIAEIMVWGFSLFILQKEGCWEHML